MQPNFSNRNTSSNLIKSSAAAGKKARRRLIGSVFMLLVALIILLNVTAKTKPIPVNPQVIEIKRNASNTAAASQTAASIVATNASSSISSANQNSSAVVGLIAASQPIVSQTESAAATSTAPATAQIESNSATETIKLDITPKILTETTGSKLSPEDILNGKTNPSPTNIYFIQLVASKSKQNITNIKTQLDKKGIRSFIQPIKTDNGPIYRLRVGPFKSKNLADKRLKELQKTI